VGYNSVAEYTGLAAIASETREMLHNS